MFEMPHPATRAALVQRFMSVQDAVRDYNTIVV